METTAHRASDILIVEDDIAIQVALAEVLADDGYCVHTCKDGEDALAFLHHTATLPKLILLDLMMPVMNGFDFRHRQRQDTRLCAIPVVVLSAITSRLEPIQIRALDAVDYIGKPINWARLERVVTRYCPP